ncbi:MAG: nucleotidyltransferase domain-containing protein [Planctomycetota bacterium JB042]
MAPVMRLDVDDIRTRLEPLFERPEIGLVVLFGSRARGTAHGGSDVDLGVLSDGEVFPLEGEVMHRLGTGRVDLVDLRRVSPLLAMAVAREGIPLYEDAPGRFASFAGLALRRYNDTARFRRLRHRRLREYLRDRGLGPAAETGTR